MTNNSAPRRLASRRRESSPSMRRAVGILAIALALAIAPRAWRWVTQDARDWEPNEPKNGEEGPSISVRDVQRFEARLPDGNKAWEFAAREIDLSADKRWATLSQVSRAILFREGNPYLWMSAGGVHFDQQTRDWQAQTDLRVSGPDGLSISSSQADWNEKEQRLDCPLEVSALFKGAHIQTIGLTYDARKGELSSLQPVTLRAPHITASGASVIADVKGRIVNFPQGVTDMRFEAPLLQKYGFKR